MNFISWLVLGAVAGALAKWLMPGRDGGGWIMTILLGIAGAFTGGYLGSFLGLGTTGELSVAGIATATAGAFVLLFIVRLIRR